MGNNIILKKTTFTPGINITIAFVLALGITGIVMAVVFYSADEKRYFTFAMECLTAGIFLFVSSILIYFTAGGKFILSERTDGQVAASITMGSNVIDVDPVGLLEYYYVVWHGAYGKLEITEYVVFSDKNNVKQFGLYRKIQPGSYQAPDEFKQINSGQLHGVKLFTGPVRKIYELCGEVEE
jgi:hypothetical protein